MPWSAVKRMLWVEKRRLAELLLKEVEENLRELSDTHILSSKVYDTLKGADQLGVFGEALARQISRTYEKVTTLNDALVKYQRFRSVSPVSEDFEKKSNEFQQFIAWYRNGLTSSLQNLSARLNEEMKEPPEQEIMTP